MITNLIRLTIGNSSSHFENSMEELASLTKTADGKVLTSVTQKRNRADAATYRGLRANGTKTYVYGITY